MHSEREGREPFHAVAMVLRSRTLLGKGGKVVPFLRKMERMIRSCHVQEGAFHEPGNVRYSLSGKLEWQEEYPWSVPFPESWITLPSNSEVPPPKRKVYN